jgi:hypothetical protein
LEYFVVTGVTFVEIIFLLIFMIDRWVADDKIKEYAMGAACSTCGGEQKCVNGFGGKT